MLKAVEEFATECSFVKVFASETLDYVWTKAVQIHGGYGFTRIMRLSTRTAIPE